MINLLNYLVFNNRRIVIYYNILINFAVIFRKSILFIYFLNIKRLSISIIIFIFADIYLQSLLFKA